MPGGGMWHTVARPDPWLSWSFFLVPYYFVVIPVFLEDIEDAAALWGADNPTVAL